MQTALQELIEKLQQLRDQYDEENSHYSGFAVAIYVATTLLAKERQQIIDAYTTGQKGIIEVLTGILSQRGITYTITIPDDDKEDGELYYEETFEK